MKKAPRSSAGQALVSDSDTDNPVESEESEESDTEIGGFTSRVRGSRPHYQQVSSRQDRVRREKEKEKEKRQREARKAEDKKLFEGLMRRYKRTAADVDEMEWMTRIWDSERQRAETLATKWVDQVAGVRAPSDTQRNRQLQTSNHALDMYVEQRRSLLKLQGAIRRARWLPARRFGHMPDFPVAYHSPRDEGPLLPSQPSRHSFVVAVDSEGEETWIVDPLLLQPAQDLASSFQGECFIVHSVQQPWPKKVAHRQNCWYLAVKAASSFVYKPTNDWNIPGPGDLFDKNKSMPEQHREEQRSTPEWLQVWSQIKVKPQLKRRGQYVPKRPQIVSTAETTLQVGLRPCGYAALSKEAVMAAAARHNGGAPDVMRSAAAAP